MNTPLNLLTKPIAIVLLALSSGSLAPIKATAGSLDCQVILCIGGSFAPAECQPAFQYMMVRITPIPSLPPFGVCNMAGPTGANAGPLNLKNPDLAYLDKFRIYWFSGSRRDTRDGIKHSWNLRSCLHNNRTCQTISRAHSSDSPPPKFIETDTGTKVELPGFGQPGMFSYRGFTVEYAPYEGSSSVVPWRRY